MPEAIVEKVLYIRRLDEKVKNEFKALCARLDLSMTDVIEELMASVVANPHIITKKMLESARDRRRLGVV